MRLLSQNIVSHILLWVAGGIANASSVPSQAHTLNPILIKAKRIKTPSPFVVGEDAKAVQKKQHTSLVEAMRDLPGVQIEQWGGAGKAAHTYIRGGNPEHALIILDGMRLNDPSLPNGAFNFGNLGTDTLAKIEVLRGPYAAQYGSDAVSGVVNIETARGRDTPSLSGAAEVGSFHTYRQFLAVQGEHNKVDFNLSANHLQTDGIASTPQSKRTLHREWSPEPYHNNSFSSRLGGEVHPDWHVSLWNRYQNTNIKYPNKFSPNPSLQMLGHQHIHRLQVEGDLKEGYWQPTLGIGYVGQERRIQNDIQPFGAKNTYQGQTIKLDWKNKVKVSDLYTAHIGIEQEKQSYHSEDQVNVPAKAKAEEKSAFLGNILQPHERWTVELWGRTHHHSQFKKNYTYRSSVQYQHLETQTQVFSAYGTALKTPALYQLFDKNYGNKNLQPETAKGWEVGLIQPFKNDMVVIGLTYFRNLFRDMILSQQVAPLSYTYLNVGSAETRGVETFIEITPQEWMRLRVDHTYLRAKDLTTGLQLPYRPLHKISAHLDFELSEAWQVGIGATYTGKKVQIDFSNASQRIYAGGVTTVRLTSSYKIDKHWECFGRIENALNRKFEQPYGYMQPGLGIYGGVRLTV